MNRKKKDDLIELATGYIKISRHCADAEESSYYLLKSMAFSLLVIAEKMPSVKPREQSKPHRQKPIGRKMLKPKLIKSKRR